MSEYSYRKMESTDVKEVSLIHQAAFENFFLTTLGLSFLETYYKACLKNQYTIAYCALDKDGKLVGFATGSLISKGYHKSVFLHHIFPFLISLAISILKKPTVLVRLAKNLEKTDQKDDDGDYAELLSIGVDPSCKGGGVGKTLLNYFKQEVKNRGGRRIVLTTDKMNNDAVLGFYKNLGFMIFYEFIAFPKREMYKLIAFLDLEDEKNI